MWKHKLPLRLPKEVLDWTRAGFDLLLKHPTPLIVLSFIWVGVHILCISIPFVGPFLFPLVDAFLAPVLLVVCLRLEANAPLDIASLPWTPKAHTFIPIVLISLLAGFPAAAALNLRLPTYQKVLLFTGASALVFSVTSLAIPLARFSELTLFEALAQLAQALWIKRWALFLFLLLQAAMLALCFVFLWVPAVTLLVPQLLAARTRIFFTLFPSMKGKVVI